MMKEKEKGKRSGDDERITAMLAYLMLKESSVWNMASKSTDLKIGRLLQLTGSDNAVKLKMGRIRKHLDIYSANAEQIVRWIEEMYYYKEVTE